MDNKNEFWTGDLEKDSKKVISLKDTDRDFANIFLHSFEYHKKSIRYVLETKKWYEWTGTHWQQIDAKVLAGLVELHIGATFQQFPHQYKPKSIKYEDIRIDDLKANLIYAKELLIEETDNKIKSVIKMEIDRLQKAIQDFGDDKALEYCPYESLWRKAKKQLFALSLKISNSSTVDSTIRMLEKTNSIQIKVNELDAAKTNLLLNFQNGTYNLETGELRRHEYEDYLTYCLDFDYDPDAKCPNFLAKVIDRLWKTNEEGYERIPKYIQSLLGYCLSGKTSLKEYYNFFSPQPHSGKSTLIDLIKMVMGEKIATNCTPGFFLAGGDRKEMVNYGNTRVLFCDEVTNHSTIDSSWIKQWTGGIDTVSERTLYKHSKIEFKPKCKIIFHGNSLPKMDIQDAASWSRVRVIPFPNTFSKIDGNKFIEQFTSERAGIINWMIEGYRMYENGALNEENTPDIVKSFTNNYKDDNDVLAEWFNEYCDTDSEAVLIPDEAWKSFVRHNTHDGIVDMTVTVNQFKKLLQNKLKSKIKTHRIDGIIRRGIKGASLRDMAKSSEDLLKKSNNRELYRSKVNIITDFD